MGIDRADATALVEELVARGHVIGDGRSRGDSGGVYEHHDPATGVLQMTVPVVGDVLDVVLPEPYGVVGAIVPWNGPMMGMGPEGGARRSRPGTPSW